MKKLYKNLSYDQKEILSDVIELHNGGKPFEADMTYSIGAFYKDRANESFHIEEPKYKFDVSPQSEDVVKIDAWGKLPLDDNSISSIVIDLPFVISPRNCKSMIENNEGSSIIAKRFSSYYPVPEMMHSYYHWINEAYRVLKDDGICVFKTQATVSGGKQYMTPEYSWLCATMAGFYTEDQYFLIAKGRLISGKVKNQMHARKFTSTFYVFKKAAKNKSIDYFKWMEDDVKPNIFNIQK
jgi:hypothetical protein